MKSLNEYIGQELRWVHPQRRSPEYELRCGDEVLVRLSRKGAFGSHAQVESSDGTWTIERKGWLGTIDILSLDDGADAGVPSIKRRITGQATLTFPGGHTYMWRCTSFWRGVWSLLSEEGAPLVRVTRGTSVILEKASGDLPARHLALLAGLGWFLHRLQEEEAASASAIVPVIGS